MNDSSLKIYLEDAWHQGYEAYIDYMRGKPVGVNPFNTEDEYEFHEQWELGWQFAESGG